MKIGALRESESDEHRVALVPETAAQLIKAGHKVCIEQGAGLTAGFPDIAYSQAGAETLTGNEVNETVDVFVHVQPPTVDEIQKLKPGALVVSIMNARNDASRISVLESAGVTAIAMELVPRIARAQRMDVLSSQASISGYKAALLAANALGKYLPMMMTAAGTIPPAKILVLGAGVAGLQAIATARRLGAIVEAFDVRTAAGEQVESLGAKFIHPPKSKDGEGSGGYAREQTEDEQHLQRLFIKEHLGDVDALITTAAIPGRPAPILVTAEMIDAMQQGSVVIDLAAESGGNVEGTTPGKIININGVSIHGPINVPSSMPFHSSQLYSRNVMALLDLIIGKKDKTLNLNLEDDVIDATCVVHLGKVRHKFSS
ncbi:MAG: Re/Si-specific NAD(P)(+) transhydrogenase subunit alpha [Chloroflexota bacterium]|nr:Re/Si-specific NAD(P)(+) transhydrogenase subunit alpha [Chloroflexota bacterium]MQG37126.1 Re/Si-specific NAD(P)(+) transhydrogenase subunit alpha [SAR202 cluster bacterium]|tara:strand:- start:61916 stop:63034 length:1119 start_codon:yes stop_codon:yes gene_type:complete